jgi:cytoskeletal protein CcmA (bactofilin family)
MWFKQNDPKSPQQAEPAAPRPQAPPAVPPAAQSGSAAVASPPPAAAPPAPSLAISPQASRITAGLSLKGELSGSEELWVGGNVEGTLRFSGARVVVGASGTVHGEIEARDIVIEGRVDGNLRADERVAISRSGQIKGDASAPRVAIEEGAVFNGAVEVIREGEPRAAARSTASVAPSASSGRHVRTASFHAASAGAASGSAPAQSVGIAAGDSSGPPQASGAPRSVAVGPPTADSE